MKKSNSPKGAHDLDASLGGSTDSSLPSWARKTTRPSGGTTSTSPKNSPKKGGLTGSRSAINLNARNLPHDWTTEAQRENQGRQRKLRQLPDKNKVRPFPRRAAGKLAMTSAGVPPRST